jgi:Uridine phosphorylase
MPLIKHELPILEYDTERTAVIMPNRGKPYSFPEKAVYAFLGDEVDIYAEKHGCEVIGEFECVTKIFPIYRAIHNGHEICLRQAPLGSSAAVMLMDFLIGYGAKQIISTGSCGALLDFPENEILVPTEALRDEGTSYHYLPPSRTVSLNPRAVTSIETALTARSVKFEECKVWTTDGFFRETPDMVRYRIDEGCAAVDMECAGLAACAQFRGAEFGQILFTADSLANIEAHDARDWGAASFAIALELALDAVCEM